MSRKLSSYFLVATLAVVCSTSAIAQSTATYSADKPATTQQQTAKKGAKPAASPGWIVIEDDWWFPVRHSFANALEFARDHFRAGEERAAAAEIEKAASWLKFAESHADKATQEDLSTAQADLRDFSAQLKKGQMPKVQQLESAFAHASTALAKHHNFKSNEAMAKSDLATAGQHLVAAVDYLREAAKVAGRETSQQVTDVYEYYSPNGYWDETIVFEKNKLEANLKTVQSELQKLASELKAK